MCYGLCVVFLASKDVEEYLNMCVTAFGTFELGREWAAETWPGHRVTDGQKPVRPPYSALRWR